MYNLSYLYGMSFYNYFVLNCMSFCHLILSFYFNLIYNCICVYVINCKLFKLNSIKKQIELYLIYFIIWMYDFNNV